jgi:hypothetical protein
MTGASVEDYPDTGYTMSAEAFAAVETPLAWSAVKPEPHPDEPPHHDWARGPANTSRVCGRGVALLTRPKSKTKQRKSVDLEGPSL